MAPAGRKRILLAELDDRRTISLLARLYEHNGTHDVLPSRTADVTRALLETERFDVIVLHTQPSHPGRVALLESSLPHGANTRILALTDTEVDASAAALYVAGADSVRPLSTPTAELADEIIRVSRAETLLEGRLDQVGAAELVQMLCLGRRTLMLRLEASHERAALWISNGEIHHAVSEALSGQAAMNRIVRADEGRFRAIAGCALPLRSIHEGWQHVLLEAAREGDEAAHEFSLFEHEPMHESEPPPEQSQVRKLGKTYRELTELGLQAIQDGDFSKARHYWDAARAIGPDGDEPLGMARSSAATGGSSQVSGNPRRFERG